MIAGKITRSHQKRTFAGSVDLPFTVVSAILAHGVMYWRSAEFLAQRLMRAR